MKLIRFSVASINCVACTPAFKNGLRRAEGVSEVREDPLLNRVVVQYDPATIDESAVREEIFRVAAKAGFAGRVVFSNRERKGGDKR